uniref:Uncharacterized protein n=1 Tax=Arundo donax TaxID=35708 RepID=A0A0A9GFW4_ARUDO
MYYGLIVWINMHHARYSPLQAAEDNQGRVQYLWITGCDQNTWPFSHGCSKNYIERQKKK